MGFVSGNDRHRSKNLNSINFFRRFIKLVQESPVSDQMIFPSSDDFIDNISDKIERKNMIYGHELQIDATVKQPNSNAISCTVTSLSDTIIKFDCMSQLNPENPVSLKIRGLNIVTAQLMWNKGEEYGCRVDFVFHPAVINAVIERSRSVEIIDPPFAGLIKTAAPQRCSW